MPRSQSIKGRPDFVQINAAALGALPALLRRWLPDGHREGREWVARNPTRNDHRPGSFKINLTTGKWAEYVASRVMLRSRDWALSHSRSTGSTQHNVRAREVA
jgi:hypothetical protein